MADIRTIAIVLPAYNAAKTLERCIKRIPHSLHADMILCDDASADNTARESERLKLITLRHPQNRGYGGNQKTLYRYVLDHGYQYVIMLHPDDQYDPTVIPDMVKLLLEGTGFVMGNRMVGDQARLHGMPLWKRISNYLLSGFLRWIYGMQLGEFHSGLRGYRADMLQRIPFERFTDNFSFDSEMIAAVAACGATSGQVSVSCDYSPEASSVNFRTSVRYGLETVRVALRYKTGYYARLLK